MCAILFCKTRSRSEVLAAIVVVNYLGGQSETFAAVCKDWRCQDGCKQLLRLHTWCRPPVQVIQVMVVSVNGPFKSR